MFDCDVCKIAEKLQLWNEFYVIPTIVTSLDGWHVEVLYQSIISFLVELGIAGG